MYSLCFSLMFVSCFLFFSSTHIPTFIKVRRLIRASLLNRLLLYSLITTGKTTVGRFGLFYFTLFFSLSCVTLLLFTLSQARASPPFRFSSVLFIVCCFTYIYLFSFFFVCAEMSGSICHSKAMF